MNTLARRLILAASLLPVFATSTASAQALVPPEARQGFYIGSGPRLGITTADNVDFGNLGTLTHFGFDLRLGQKMLPWLALGVVITGGSEANEDWALGYGGLQIEGQIEPFADLDLALRLGTGAAGGGMSAVGGQTLRDDDAQYMFGPLFSAGLSYDWFPFHDPKSYRSGGFALTFLLEGRYLPGGDITTGGGFLGVELTYWFGLDKNKLELPVEEAF